MHLLCFKGLRHTILEFWIVSLSISFDFYEDLIMYVEKKGNNQVGLDRFPRFLVSLGFLVSVRKTKECG